MNIQVARQDTSDENIKKIALMITMLCVRKTIIERYHERGSLSQADMKAFNKEVSNKIYTFLYVFTNGTEDEKRTLFKVASLFYPENWDKPVMDYEISGYT